MIHNTLNLSTDEKVYYSVTTATLIGECIGAGLLVCAVAMTWWLCRRRREHTKLSADKSLAFRPPHRKPTAVKSPGSQGHYLKKSPSPTGPAKSPPGSAGARTPSPTGPQPGNLPGQTRSPPGTYAPNSSIYRKLSRGFRVANDASERQISGVRLLDARIYRLRSGVVSDVTVTQIRQTLPYYFVFAVRD